MKNKSILLSVVLLVIIGGIFISRTLSKTGTVTPEITQPSLNQTQTDEKGAVTVKVTPKILVKGQKIQLDIAFDTHSVELDYDIATIARLTDDNGNIYKPLSWTGGKGGHHVEGILTFPALSESKKVTLTIPGIDTINRVFVWNVNN